MFNLSNRGLDHASIRRVKDWIRESADIPDSFTIMVTELRCVEPGCPPIETVVALLGPNQLKYQQKIHASILEVSQAQAVEVAHRFKSQLAGQEIQEEHTHDG